MDQPYGPPQSPETVMVCVPPTDICVEPQLMTGEAWAASVESKQGRVVKRLRITADKAKRSLLLPIIFPPPVQRGNRTTSIIEPDRFLYRKIGGLMSPPVLDFRGIYSELKKRLIRPIALSMDVLWYNF